MPMRGAHSKTMYMYVQTIVRVVVFVHPRSRLHVTQS